MCSGASVRPPFSTFGVGQESHAFALLSPSAGNKASAASSNCLRLLVVSLLPFQSCAPAVGQCEDKQPLPLVRSAHVRCTDERFRNPVTQALQFASDNSICGAAVSLSNSSDVWDVFQKHERRPRPVDNPADVRPQVAIVFVSSLLTSDGERLTRVPRRDEIHDSTPAAAVEGCEVVPDRSLIQPPLPHARRQDCGGIGFPLDVTDGAVGVSEGKAEAEFEPAAAGT